MSVQKLRQVIKSNTTGFLTIQRRNTKILKRMLVKITDINWSEHWSKRISLINSEDLRNDIDPYSQILKNGDETLNTLLKDEKIQLLQGKV